MATPEHRVKEKVKGILKKYNIWYFMYVPTGYGQGGVPDIICCVRGQFLAIECKATPNKEPTELQKIQLHAIQQSQGRTFVATPSNIEELEGLIRRLSNDD